MKTTSLTARRLITTDGIVENPRIAIHADGTIASIEAGKPGSEAAGADETTLTPAFFDVHVHGAAGHDVMEATPESLGCIGRSSGACFVPFGDGVGGAALPRQ